MSDSIRGEIIIELISSTLDAKVKEAINKRFTEISDVEYHRLKTKAKLELKPGLTTEKY